MSINRQLIKSNAKVALKNNYWPFLGIMLLIGVIVSACSVTCIGAILVMPVIAIGYEYYVYRFYKQEDVTLANSFDGFKKFGHVLGGWWYMYLFTFLWTLLFIIPGIVKGYAYSMTPYILMEEPELSVQDALKKSMAMTKGHKWEMFVFDLSFLGWIILSCFTCGILMIFYVAPYYTIARAGIYDNLKAIENGSAEA